MYWVEFNNAVVRKLDPQGVISTVAGRGATPTGAPTVDGPATSVCLGAVYGMDVDAAGSVYIAIAATDASPKSRTG